MAEFVSTVRAKTVANHSVARPQLQRKCGCGGSAGFSSTCPECQRKKFLGKPLQPKLRINEPGDVYEQEADRVAEQVMRMAETDSEAGNLRSNAAVQRRVAANEPMNGNSLIIQRVEVASEMAASEGTIPKDTEGSRCPSWRADPESISKRAAETYVQNDMTPPSQATVERIDCEPPIFNGNYGCYVHFSDGLVIRVIVRAKDIVVGVPPINTLTPPPATPLCFYDYHCPEGLLVLTLRECKSAKPTGPTTIVQRRAAAGGTGSVDAGPLVNTELSSPGQPLDSATRAFFEPRFGHDFSRVRVHAGGMAEQSARDVNAHAYTMGHNIVFGAGRFSPETLEGRRLIAHELTHVVQQSGANGMTSGVVQRQPAGKTEAYYQRLVKQKKWCRDSEETGQLHPGQQCYRQIPSPLGYPPGDQVCFSKATGKFVEPPSLDIYSPVYGQNADGTCDIAMKFDLLKFWTLRSRRALGHGAADVLTEDTKEFGLWYGRFSGVAMGIALPKGLDSDLASWAIPSILGYLGGKLGERGLPRLTRLAEKHGFLPTVSLGFGSNVGLGLGIGLEKRDRPLPLVPINTYLTFGLDSTLALGGEVGESSTFLAKVGVRIDPGKQGGVFALGSFGAGLALGEEVSGAASAEVGVGVRPIDFLDVQVVRETVAGGAQGGDTYWLMLKLVAPQRVLERRKKPPVPKQWRSPKKTGP